ncbi:MAG: TonB-dependent receptor, partial [Bacteroidales bacterium]|nr:TonB-dependent receptor [Bacteroidales bacterium]
MQEFRSMAVLKYKKDINETVSQEYVLRHQYHAIDWDMYYYRNGAFGDYYPNSVNEYLKTGAQDIFTRAQYSFNLANNAKLLAAAEYTALFYSGDKEHYSNTDLIETFEPYPNNQQQTLGSWLEYIDGKAVNNLASFVQFSSGTMFGDFFKVTAGLRYDTEFFNYTDINDGNKEKSKNFNELSPRLVLIFIPSEKFTIKLIGGKAFRAPTPTELFGSNTWTLASNLNQLEPERIQTAELALDYQINNNLVVRLNGFYNKSEGQIAYS